jgi:hypothetical protein
MLVFVVLGIIGAANGGNKQAATSTKQSAVPTLPTFTTQEMPAATSAATDAVSPEQAITNEPKSSSRSAPITTTQAATSQATVEPTPTADPTPAPVNSATGTYYADCDAARAAGVAPLSPDQPGYRPALDRDHDGIACE